MSDFDAKAEVAKLKAETKARRKRVYSRRISKIDPYKGEVLSLYREGASGVEIQSWLKSKRVTCSLSTVTRYLLKNG